MSVIADGIQRERTLKAQVVIYMKDAQHLGVIYTGESADLVIPSVGDNVKTDKFVGQVIERRLSYEPGPELKAVIVLGEVPDTSVFAV